VSSKEKVTRLSALMPVSTNDTFSSILKRSSIVTDRLWGETSLKFIRDLGMSIIRRSLL
jgi:hypothetical protein